MLQKLVVWDRLEKAPFFSRTDTAPDCCYSVLLPAGLFLDTSLVMPLLSGQELRDQGSVQGADVASKSARAVHSGPTASMHSGAGP
jgi:hypothetical protein